MAEVKNAFIKSKMNKDLDARLIPQGEYRDAVNIQVSKSEGDDVGALENVLGNVSRADFEADSGVSNLTCIGYFVNEFDSNVYLFFTDYTDAYSTPIPTYDPNANNFIYQCSLASNPNPTTPATIKKLVEGSFLNFSTNRPIIGVNVLENFLFFTDNRNQPRKINISLANPNNVSNPTYYNIEENISVAKYYPYKPIDVIKETSTLGEYETTMYDAFSEFIPLNEGTPGGAPTPPNVNNPYYESNFPGDPQFLEDKFVRFSYRFKFSDGEYSLISPFTQICFIPKQDGYFLQGDEKQTFGSTIVKFMENKVNKIDLQIPLPSAGDQLLNNFHISEIDIIYKESDGLALQVVETIPIDASFANSVGSNTVFEYSYLSQKPYKTLPSSEITRVYDKVPVRALGQEIISNRVVYSNFQDKHTPPSFIKYQVGANEKYIPTNANSSKTSIEYPNHSLKQNRNYQVGFVLADRYGRQSTVILSNDQDPTSAGGFGADTVYLPYRPVNDSIDFLGDSLKISVNAVIQSNKNDINTPNQPGLYNGDSTSTDYNPLGWETYKIVVKQLEQEYYNVYTAGAMKGLPEDNTSDLNTSFITLVNDNINKVPRDLTEVGPQDKTFRSSVRLFGRVENNTANFSNIGNEQYLPNNTKLSFTTNAIEDLFDLFTIDTSTHAITSDQNPYHAFYKAESNPFVAEFITTQTTADQFGVIAESNQPYLIIENLAILETAPTISRLDLFYETSTVGDIDTLNQNAGPTSGGGVRNVNTAFQYTHFEDYATGTDVTNTFWFIDFGDNKIDPASAVLTSVTDNSGSGTNRYLEWTLVSLPDSEYKLQTNAYFYYSASPDNAGLQESYNFTFEVTTNQGISTVTGVSGLLQNSDPSIDNSNATTIQALVGQQSVLPNLTGKNGSNDQNSNTTTYTQNLTFSIVSSTGNGVYSVVNNNEVQNSNTQAAGTGSFTVRVTDNGNPTAKTVDKTFDIVFDKPNTNLLSYKAFPTLSGAINGTLTDSRGAAIYFTANFDNLTDNIPNNFGNINYNSNGYNTSFYLKGLVQNLSTPINNRSVCDPNQVGFMGAPGSQNSGFANERQTTGGLTTGAFYVYFNPMISKSMSGMFNPEEINFRYQIAYRVDSNDTWSTAVDINGNAADYSGTWKYDGQGTEGLDNQYYVGSNWLSSGSPQVVVAKIENNSAPRYAGLVYAFDTPGEYRILHSNMASTFGKLTPQGDNQNGFSCTAFPYYSTEMEHVFETGDFYYPGSSAGGIDDAIAAGSGDSNNVFRYRISQGSCSSLPSLNIYAREPVAKYVTQLYTDQALSTKLQSISGGTSYVIRRMENLSSTASAYLNPEYTKNGTYQISFQNTTGLVSTGLDSPKPCYY